MSEYYPPEHESEKFNCPHCKIYAHQRWSTMYIEGNYGHEVYHSMTDNIEFINASEEVNIDGKPVKVSLCSYCEAPTLWVSEKMIFPITGVAPPANNDLPDSVEEIYNEASTIATQSPRAACALLRLAIEMLLKELGETGSINEGIKNLVKKGVDPIVQQSLDIVRITGNSAVHPGKIAFDDTTDVHTLFQFINVIANTLITLPKQTQEIYDNLPEDARKAIGKRDS